MQPKTAVLASIAFFLSVSVSVVAADWPNWRGPDHNGISLETNWNTQWPGSTVKQLWKAQVGTGFSSVSVADGKVYTMGNAHDTDTVFCISADAGTVLWKHSYPCLTDPKYYEGGPSATPTVAEGKVYTFSRKGDVFCLDAIDGKVSWSTNLAKGLGIAIPTWGFASSALVEGNKLLLNAGDYGLALDKSSGKVIWSTGTNVGGYSTPLPSQFDGAKAIVLFGSQIAAAIAVDTGKQLWQFPWKSGYDVNAADPIIVGDKVFISSGYNHGAALLRIKGNQVEEIWENKLMRNHINSSVLIDGYLYGFDGDTGPKASLKCMDFNTGEIKWTMDKMGAGALTASGKNLIVITDHGELMVAEATPVAFKPISRAQVLGGRCWTVPVLASGRIYCRNARGDLICLDVKQN